MSTPIVVPQLGNEIEEAEITEWLVKEGESVTAGDPIVVITTTKMSLELEAPTSGTIKHITAEEGDLAKVGTTLGEIE